MLPTIRRGAMLRDIARYGSRDLRVARAAILSTARRAITKRMAIKIRLKLHANSWNSAPSSLPKAKSWVCFVFKFKLLS